MFTQSKASLEDRQAAMRQRLQIKSAIEDAEKHINQLSSFITNHPGIQEAITILAESRRIEPERLAARLILATTRGE